MYAVSFRFKAKEDFQCYGDVFFDILLDCKQGSCGSRYVLIHFETLIRSLNKKRMSPAKTN